MGAIHALPQFPLPTKDPIRDTSGAKSMVILQQYRGGEVGWISLPEATVVPCGTNILMGENSAHWAPAIRVAGNF
jgi:hypothetical protein